MRHYTASETGLLLIDVQKGFDHPTHWGTSWSTPNFEANITAILAAFRKAGSSVFHVCHHSTFETSPLHPSKASSGFMPYVAPIATEPAFAKTTNSPFLETTLKEAIQAAGINRLVVVGLITSHCIATTIRTAANLNVVAHTYGTPPTDGATQGALVLVSDATATPDVYYAGRHYDAETVQAIQLATMKDEFCDIETTLEVLSRLGTDESAKDVHRREVGVGRGLHTAVGINGNSSKL